MKLTGKQYIGSEFSGKGSKNFQAMNPATGEKLQGVFTEAMTEEVDKAVTLAERAFKVYRNLTPERKAGFLEEIAEELMRTGDKLINRCMEETGLPEARLIGERARTTGQLKLFAELIREGSWVNASIDTAIPDRAPLPKPDLRQMQKALGPVGIFGASNFPFAFSVAGGDTASALAAGCSVVVKGHPAHPGTSELTAAAILRAARTTGMPEGVFSMVQGAGTEVGMAIVNHPLIKAIGFTGSFRGGKALFDAAVSREEPIPVYAEMGSINPVFILPEALKTRGEVIASGLSDSITLGTGQFCTNPGLVVTDTSEGYPLFIEKTAEKLSGITASAMLTAGIREAYENGINTFLSVDGVAEIARGKEGNTQCGGIPRILTTTAEGFLKHKNLAEEVFGPSSLIVTAHSKNEMISIAENLEGHLTATILGTENDLEAYDDLIEMLERKVGRLIINGFPTGVEVCHSMVHGGPFPATTDARTTSVGTSAIYRFTRPVCYQGFPDKLLPDELKNDNPRDVFRLVNGKYTREKI